VPIAVGAESREEPIGRATPPLVSQGRSVAALVAIDDSREAATGPTAGLDRRERKAG
jgi:hypothetical protein